MTNTMTPPPDDEVPWLADDERGAWMTLISLIMSLPAAIDAQLKRDSGLNFFEYSILSALSRPPGRSVRMNTLALYAGGSASRLSHAVTRLEKQGWVRREVHVGEVRCTEATITDKGVAMLESAAPGHVREARRLVFDAIAPEQVGQLQQICRQLVGATAPELAAALDRAIAEAAAEQAGPGATELDQAFLDHASGSPCTAVLADEAAGADGANEAAEAHKAAGSAVRALDEALVGHTAASPCSAALDEPALASVAPAAMDAHGAMDARAVTDPHAVTDPRAAIERHAAIDPHVASDARAALGAALVGHVADSPCTAALEEMEPADDEVAGRGAGVGARD